ncbi:MAG: hypothetical protein GKR77_04005 [Legionellales bacterium]|nr:hypothetical protein [Legionellales bacterium]
MFCSNSKNKLLDDPNAIELMRYYDYTSQQIIAIGDQRELGRHIRLLNHVYAVELMADYGYSPQQIMAIGDGNEFYNILVALSSAPTANPVRSATPDEKEYNVSSRSPN